ncbi:MAG: peptide ABC transporter substrate-binding protein [Planctomycetes bacterium]|nr:peptide ABC transporter substrate-binding protein [Planctomycetota bacterium]
MRIAVLSTVVPALALSLALCCLPGRARAGDGEDSNSTPRSGEALKKFDWGALFEPGDSWKKHEQKLVWNNETEPETLDPAIMTGTTEHNLALALFEGLATHHPETLEPVPGVAEWWDVSPDGVTYTFHLRKDAAWSNGEPVTSEDFRYSWIRALDPVTASQYAYMLYPIRGAQRFNTWHAAKDDQPATDALPAPKESDVAIDVVDPLTLKVTLEAPCAYFLELVSFETLMPVHRATVEKHKSAWTQPEHIVSNGPFQLDLWKPRDRIEMVPNPKWWNRKIVRLDRMVIRAIDEQSTSLNEYLSGGVDWIRSIPARRVEEAQAHPDYYVAPYLGTYFFRFNVTQKPFDDVRVRKAFNLAVDKKSICEKFLKAGQIPATGIVSPGIHGYPELAGDAYDPKRAREMLAEAGFPEGRGFPEVELLYNTSESHKGVCEQLVEMWKSNLGVKIQLANREWKVYLDDVDHKRYQIARAAWIGDYADPNTFLDMWVTDGGNNSTGWSNKKYDAMIAAAAKEPDPAKRFAIFQECERMVAIDELPVMPLYYYVNQGMLRPRVKGWHDNVRDLHPFQYIYIDGPAAESAK